MKSITQLSLLAATVAVLASGSAFADDQQMKNQLQLQRAQDGQAGRVTSIAVYSNGRGVGYNTAAEAPAETRFELRSNAHGDQFGAFVAVR